MTGPGEPACGGPLEIVFEDERWREARLSEIADRAARAALNALDIDPDTCEIGMLATNDVAMRALNARFRGKDRPTNILSWPSGETDDTSKRVEPVFLGDVALAYETCRSEAEEGGITLEAHVLHLVVHGMLHLAGYDHELDADAEEMEAFEVKILESLGVENPY